MSFRRYVSDKRFFLLMYALTMAFVSLVMVGASRTAGEALDDVLYVNAGCLFLAASYVVIGYFCRRSFYDGLKHAVESDSEETAAAMPQAQNAAQTLYLEAFNRLAAVQTGRLQRSAEEQRERYEFIMSWIHEVKLPIAASRLLLENGGQAFGHLADKLEDELGKIDHYVEQALYYTRIDSFSNDYFITEVSLERIAKETVKKYAKLFITKRIAVRLAFDGDSGAYAHTDGKWLAYIVDQIVANALKYTPEDGRIVFRFEEDAKEKRLVVTDTGIGILPEDIGRVFEKGFTGANGRRHAKSTGMGLYLARQLALKLGHELSAASEPGVRTSVTVHFPRLRSYYPGR